MNAINPMVLSTIALVVSAVSAMVAFWGIRINRRNQIESVRPELLLQDWARPDPFHYEDEDDADKPFGDPANLEFLTIRKLRNAGKGAAYNISLFYNYTAVDQKTCFYRRRQFIPVLVPGDTFDQTIRIGIDWDRFKAEDEWGDKHATLHVRLDYEDAVNLHHSVHIQASIRAPGFGGFGNLAAGLDCIDRSYFRVPRWRHRIGATVDSRVRKIRGWYLRRKKLRTIAASKAKHNAVKKKNLEVKPVKRPTPSPV